MIFQKKQLLEVEILNSHKNMLLVVGSSGNQQPKQHGTTHLEFKSRSPQQITYQEIELSQCGLANLKVEFYISQLIVTITWLVLVMSITIRTSNTKIDIRNGSMFTMDIQEQLQRLKYLLNGQAQMIHLCLRMLDTISLQNSICSSEEINNSQVSVVNQDMLNSILERDHISRMLTLIIQMMLLASRQELRILLRSLLHQSMQDKFNQMN